MKEEYSKVNYPDLRQIKKFLQKDSLYLQKVRTNIMLSNLKQVDKIQSIAEMNLANNIIVEKEFLNYYIDSKELSDFFINTSVKKEILSNFKEITQKNSNRFIEISSNKSKFEFDFQEQFTGIVHNKSLDRSILFLLAIQTNWKFPNIFLTNGDDTTIIPFNTNDDSLMDFINNQPQKQNSEFIKLVLNMLFYMDAFPDKISNKPPEEMCDKLNFNNSKTISIAKDIEDYLHENREVSPHLRRGHFRFLGNERFTKKKGQTVFVKSSFVKGKAVTVNE